MCVFPTKYSKLIQCNLASKYVNFIVIFRNQILSIFSIYTRMSVYTITIKRVNKVAVVGRDSNSTPLIRAKFPRIFQICGDFTRPWYTRLTVDSKFKEFAYKERPFAKNPMP